MSWSKVGDFLKGSLPILGTALGGPAGGIAGGILSKLLGVEENPDDVLEKLKQDPEAILKYKLSELECNKEILIACQQAEENKLRIVNETMRNESNSQDAFVRRWRPFYGYAVAISWAVQMMGFTFMFVYVGIKSPEQLPTLVQNFALLSGSLITLWGIALAVLGVSVHKRSKDKQITPIENGTGVISNAKQILKNIIK